MSNSSKPKSSYPNQLLPAEDLLDIECKVASHFAPLLEWDNTSNAEWPNPKLGERRQEPCKSEEGKMSFTFKWPGKETQGGVELSEGGVKLEGVAEEAEDEVEEERGRSRTRKVLNRAKEGGVKLTSIY